MPSSLSSLRTTLTAVLLLTPAVAGQGQLRWSYLNPTGTAWTTSSVSIGNEGTFAWLGHSRDGYRFSLFSTTEDNNPPVAIMEQAFSPLQTGSIQVEAADMVPASLVLEHRPGLLSRVHYFLGIFSIPLRTLDIPVNNGMTSSIIDSGERFAVSYLTPTSCVTNAYQRGFGLPVWFVENPGGMNGLDYAGDASRLLVGVDDATVVYDGTTGGELFRAPLAVPGAPVAIDGNGDTWARGGVDLRAWVETGGTYQEILSFSQPSTEFPVCDVSADGTTLVAGAWDPQIQDAMAVYCFNLTAVPPQLLWTFSHQGTGGQNLPTAVSISDNGRWIAVTATGALAMSQPELLLFDRDAGSVPVDSLDTPGSLLDVDISHDGQFVLAGGRQSHTSVGGIPTGAAYSFDRGGQTFRLFGTPAGGRNIALTVTGQPGDVAFFLAGPTLGPGFSIPGFTGTLGLSQVLLSFPIGVVPAAGPLSLPLNNIGGPGLFGPFYCQTVRVGATNAFDNTLTIWVTP